MHRNKARAPERRQISRRRVPGMRRFDHQTSGLGQPAGGRTEGHRWSIRWIGVDHARGIAWQRPASVVKAGTCRRELFPGLPLSTAQPSGASGIRGEVGSRSHGELATGVPQYHAKDRARGSLLGAPWTAPSESPNFGGADGGEGKGSGGHRAGQLWGGGGTLGCEEKIGQRLGGARGPHVNYATLNSYRS